MPEKTEDTEQDIKNTEIILDEIAICRTEEALRSRGVSVIAGLVKNMTKERKDYIRAVYLDRIRQIKSELSSSLIELKENLNDTEREDASSPEE